MKNKDKSAYVMDDTIILAGLTSISGGVAVGVFGMGTVDGITLTNIVNNSGFSLGDATINKTDVNNHEGLYSLSSIQFDIVKDDDQSTTQATYSYFAVPKEVTADRTVFMDGPLGVMVGVLPLLIVAGLVTGAVVWFINRKS